jgi:hypothetical protein
MADTSDSKSLAERREGSSPSSRTETLGAGAIMSDSEKVYQIEQALWPIAIVQDRYSGTYTGGRWVAIPHADYASFDYTVWGDDGSCMEWAFENIEEHKQVGVGDTPQEALDDLFSIAENVFRRPNPRDEVRRLRRAILAHREKVLQDPSKTAEAEDELWGILEAKRD